MQCTLMKHTLLLTLTAVTFLGISSLVAAGTVVLPGIGPNYHIKVESFKARKFREVVKQQYDFSCGSAAVATLLSFHYAHPVSEQEVFNAMYALADPVKVQREGFSMLDMKKYLESLGYRSDGFKLSLDKLDTVARVPAITILNTNGYNHFVVIKGVRDGGVLIGDPAVGSRVFDREVFLKSWSGLVFLVRNHVEQGRLAYDMDASWEAHAHANFASLLDAKNLSQLTLSLPRANDF